MLESTGLGWSQGHPQGPAPAWSPPGDVLVLTKPLGSQIAANLALWLGDPEKWRKASQVIDVDTALRAVQRLGPGNWWGSWDPGMVGICRDL